MNPQRNAGLSASTTMEKPQSDTCVQCGAAIGADAKFCRSCGTPVAASQDRAAAPDAVSAACSRCHGVNSVGSRFCCSCGAALPIEEKDVTPPAPTLQVPVPAASSEPSPPLENPAVGRAFATRKRVPVAVVAVVAVIAAGAGAAITLVAKGSAHGSHAVGAALTNAATPGTAATPETTGAVDSSAKTLAQTAQTAAETYATENVGEYKWGTSAEGLTKLNKVEPAINITKTTEAELTAANELEEGKGYEVTATAQTTGDKYTVVRKPNGEVEHVCVSSSSGCPGHANSSSSW